MRIAIAELNLGSISNSKKELKSLCKEWGFRYEFSERDGNEYMTVRGQSRALSRWLWPIPEDPSRVRILDVLDVGDRDDW